MLWQPIGVVHSCFREKFGIPRQPGLAPHARAWIEMNPPYDDPDAFRGLEAFSHLWVAWVFHQNKATRWSPLVRPPRLGGNAKKGVFATRSPYRPNPLGLSVVELVDIQQEDRSIRLLIRGADMVDGTPVIDIKPYIPYADALPEALADFAAEPPRPRLRVTFSEHALDQLRHIDSDSYPDLDRLIVDVLAGDPRPAYRANEAGGEFAMRLYQWDVKWRIEEDRVEVLALEPMPHREPEPGKAGGTS